MRPLVAALGSVSMLALTIPPAVIATADLGEVETVGADVPCWVSDPATGPSSFLEVIIGSMRGKLLPTGAPEAVADAFFDNQAGDCGEDDLAGNNVPPLTTFLIRLDSAYAIDDAPSNGGSVTFEFSIRRCTSTNCNSGCGTPTTLTPVTVSFGSSPSYDWYEVDPWGAFSFTDTTPSSSDTDSWAYTLTTTTGVTGGGSASQTQSGCFNVTSEP